MSPLALRQVDIQSGSIRLDPGQAKNEEGRPVYLPADLKALVAVRVRQLRALERKLRRIIPHIFPAPLRGRHRGERIQDYRRAGQGSCRRARIGPRLRHDFRRTAVRNLVDSGVLERLAELSGNRIGVVVQPG